MDKLVAIIMAVLAVVLLASVLIFGNGGLMEKIGNKSDYVGEQIDASGYRGYGSN